VKYACGLIDFIIGCLIIFDYADISEALIGSLFMQVGVIIAFHLGVGK
jgi:hypothetical protein